VLFDLCGVVRTLARGADKKDALDGGMDVYELADIRRPPTGYGAIREN
jgi:hypothetical protein